MFRTLKGNHQTKKSKHVVLNNIYLVMLAV
jgi:hypothetical protein